MNRYWTLSDKPVGAWPDAGTFVLREEPVPKPGPGQALTRTIYVWSPGARPAMREP